MTMPDLTPFYDALRRGAEAHQSGLKGYDAATGLTEAGGLIKGSRARFRAVIATTVEREAREGGPWPSRAARRAWVRAEVARRYRSMVSGSAD